MSSEGIVLDVYKSIFWLQITWNKKGNDKKNPSCINGNLQNMTEILQPKK